MSAPRCGVCTTGLSKTTSGWSMAFSSARSCDLMNPYHRSRPGKLIGRLPVMKAAICTGHGSPPRHIEHRPDQRHNSVPSFMRIDAYAPLCIRCQGTAEPASEMACPKMEGPRVALGDAILACLTERPMTGYEL